MNPGGPVDVAFALALLRLDGVGRVTAHRILERFPTHADVLSTPREQVLLRLGGLPNVDRTVGLLFAEADFEVELARSRQEISRLRERHMDVISNGHAHWPPGVGDLARADRPVVLYTFGSTDVLAGAAVGLHARPPLPEAAFEALQGVARKLIDHRIAIAVGVRTSVDVVLHKLCAGARAPCVLVAGCGLARVEPRMRPSVAAAVKAGGVLISPFPPTHGPFDHDDGARILLQTGLSGPSLFAVPAPGSPEFHALEWALEHGRPVFAIGGSEADEPDSLPERVHLLNRPIDLEWVVAAARVGASL